MKLEELKNEVKSFTEFENNWDGDGGIPVSEDIAEKVISLLNILDEFSLEKINNLYPHTNGSIEIAWTNGDNEDVILYIDNTYVITVVLNGCEMIGESGINITEDISILKSALSKLFYFETRETNQIKSSYEKSKEKVVELVEKVLNKPKKQTFFQKLETYFYNIIK